MSTLTAKIQLRRDTSANWATNNPILLAGEVAFTTDVFYSGTDQQRFKIGDGIQTWSQLDYVPEGGAGFPEHLYLTVVNKTGDNLLASEYKVMKVTDAQGQRLAVDYALADSNGNSTDTIGIVYENINNNASGKLITVGEITGINTTGSLQGQTWEDGNVLYLDSTTPGNLSNIQPTAPNHLVVMGYVVHAHQNQGKIYVKITNGFEIGELHNVYVPQPSHNDGIFWSSGTTRYENKTIVQALGYTPENTVNKSIDGTLNANSDTLYPSQKAVKTYVDGSVTGLLDDRGNYDASGNVFPSTGGSGTAGAILKGDLWYISVGGTLGGTSVVVGSSIRALTDSPGQTSTNWSILNVGVGYTPENSANKATDFSTVNNTLYPTVQAVKTYADTVGVISIPVGWLTAGNIGSSNYYFGTLISDLPIQTATPPSTRVGHYIRSPKTGTFKKLVIGTICTGASVGTTPRIFLNNITQNTSVQIGNFLIQNGTNNYSFTLSANENDLLELRILSIGQTNVVQSVRISGYLII